jgi:hypothetical protein
MVTNRPDQGPDPGGGRDLGGQFEILISNTEAMNEALRQQTETLKSLLDLELRSQIGAGRQEGAGHMALAMQYQQQMRPEIMRSLARGAGVPHDPTAGMTKISGLQATTSLQNLQAYAAQRLGEAIAGGTLPGMGRLPAWAKQRLSEPPRQRPGKPSALYAEHGEEAHAATAGHPQPGAPAAPRPAAPQWQPLAPPGPGGRLGAGMAAQIRQMSTTPAGPAADAEKAGTNVVSAVEKGVEKGIEAEGGLGGRVEQAVAGISEQLRPDRPRVPLPSESVGGVEQGAGGVSSNYLTVPAATGSGGPPGGAGGAGGGGGRPGGGGGGPSAGGGAGGVPPSLMQNIGARVAMSGGTPGGVLGLLKKIPGVGLIVDAANAGANAYITQREAGRVYQEQEGGTNLSAQTERAHAFAYEASMFGRVPEGVAAQMFGDVTALGLNRANAYQGTVVTGSGGQSRQNALNFLYHQYTATGMDPQQGAAILNTATQNATVNLNNVSDALTTLSDAAGKAGSNAIQARDNFNSYFQVALTGAGAGPGAPQLAGALATQQAQLGPAFAKTNFAGQLGAGEQYMLSGQTGLAPNQIQALERQNPAGYAAMVSGSVMRFVQQLPGMTPAMMQDLQNMVQQAGGASVKQQPQLQQQVANQFLNKYQSSTPGMDLNVWAQFLSQVSNVPLNAGNVMQYIVAQVAGATFGGAAATPGSGAPGTAQGGGAGGTVSAQTAAAHGAGGAATGQYGLAQAVPVKPAPGRAGALGITTGGQTWQQVLTGGGQGAAAQQYLGQEKKSGQRSPVLEALLQNVPKDTQVAVQTASGSRVMSFADAMKYYPDELEAGQVQFYDKNGKNLGSTGNFTKGLLDPNAQGGANAEAAAKGAGTRTGQALSQFQKAHGITPSTSSASSQATTGGLTVDLSNEAKQLLKLLPSNSDNAAAAATVPSNPNVASTSR